jgi:ABC-2 type transport system permease protein
VSLWRLEWLRLFRTPRAISLAAVYLLIGAAEPVLTRYQNQLIGHLSHGTVLRLPPATPAQALDSYVSQISTVGLIVVVVLAAGAFSFDASPGLSVFLRTRTRSMWQLLAPRFAVNAAAAGVAYLLGTLAAWYATWLLIGGLPAGLTLAGIAFEIIYLTFAVALTALAASLARGTLAATAITLALLLALPIAGSWRVIASWLPSALVADPVALVERAHHLDHYLPALAVTAVATVVLLAVAAIRLREREI